MQQIFNIQPVDPQQFEAQVYSQQDTQIISSFNIEEAFDASKDYVEYFVYDADKELIYSSIDYNYTNYRVYDNQIAIDPQEDIQQAGYNSGQYYVVYNFLTNLLSSNSNNRFFISEISSDRTEIRLDTNTIPNSELLTATTEFLANFQTSDYYQDFFLNFGDNELIIANNIALDTTDLLNPTILIKLYEPLPIYFDVKTELWVVENLTEPIAYSIEMIITFDDAAIGVQLKGPNTNIQLGNLVNSSDAYYSFDSLNQTTQALGTGSLQYQLNSMLEEKGIELNIDYSNYSNFVHFSSAQTRLENFYYKLALLEQYQTNAVLGNNNNTYVSASQTIWQSKINNIITNFDGYEYYLYYESSSTAWPKTNSQPPYTNALTTSTEATTWYAIQVNSASLYDEFNKDALVNAIPPYLKDDPDNNQFELFVQMIGQHFDIVWTYTKDITNKFNADNRLDHGVSKDIIADVLRDLGIKIYQNNFSTQNLYSAILGITPSGSLLNIPNTTLDLPAATGLEYISAYVTASSTSSLIPLEDANKEIYKRIYHNLPYLLKKKGTTAGLRTLINLYGVPDTILRINEFGGQDKVNSNDWDNWQDTFNYALIGRDAQIVTEARLYPSTIPSCIQFRFKTPDLTTLGLENGGEAYYALLTAGESPDLIASTLVLEYSGSGLATGSYSGSVVDPYNKYGTLKWIPNTDPSYYGTSASLYLPFFNEGWWSVMINLSSGSATSFTEPITGSLFAKQKGTYEGNNYISYEQSESVQQAQPFPYNWSYIYTIPTNGVSLPNAGYQAIPDAQYQELRYFNTQISESIFDDYVMNPYSIEGNQISGSQSAYTSLRFRAPLGADLTIPTTTTVQSKHPSVTGSATGVPTASFDNGATTYLLDPGVPAFTTNQEFIYQKQPNIGIQTAISDKIKIVNPILPEGNVLSQYRSLQQSPIASASYTRDVNYLEVGFSPQDEINDDIIDQLGYFNLGDYVGDPRFQTSSATSYPELDQLRNQYFQKYIKNYNLTDYLRLIKFFDNSLFKMVKDFVPARTGLASGAIIKQHILERNRYRTPQVDWESKLYTGSATTLANDYRTGSVLYSFSGSTGGSFPSLASYTSSGYYPPYINISQSWTETVLTPLGSNTIVHNNLEEFYNGELEGTTLTVTDQSLIDADCQIFLDVNVDQVDFIPVLYRYDTTSQTTFLSSVVPIQGEINFFYIEEYVDQGNADSSTNNNLPTD